MIKLHKNLQALTKLASKEAIRYPLTGIHVQETKSGYSVEATDGKLLGRVDGPACNVEELPEAMIVKSTIKAAILPADELHDALKQIKRFNSTPVLEGLVIGLGALDEKITQTVTLTKDLVPITRPIKHVEGNFPDTNGVMPKGKQDIRIDIDAELMIKLLQVALAISGKGNRVTLDFWTANKGTGPVRMTTEKNEDGQKFIGLIMPLVKPKR